MRKSQIPILALLALLLASVGAAAQAPVGPTSQLTFDHNGVDVDRFESQVDGGAWTTLAAVKGPGETFSAPLPSLTPGPHTIAVRACGDVAVGCSGPSNVLSVRMVIVPSAPTDLRITTTGSAEARPPNPDARR